MLDDVGASTNPAEWTIMHWEHSAESRDSLSGDIYPPTKVEYKLAIKFSSGMIIVFEAFSPVRVRAEGAPDLVPLHRFSDIVWLIWKQQCEASKKTPRDLRYIFYWHLNNPAAFDTIESITHKDIFSECRSILVWSLQETVQT